MKTSVISILAAVLIVLVAFPANILAGPPGSPPHGNPHFSGSEIVVGFKPGVTPPGMAVAHSQAGGRAKHDIPALGAQVVSIPAGTVGQSIRRYEAHPLVAYAEPNYTAEAVGDPNDTYFPSQWGLHNVEAPAAWDITTGSSDVIIAILDTGVAPEHPDLGDKIVDNVNFTDSATSDDVHGHGTHVAGIAAAVTNNAMGVAGLGYDSSIMNVKVLGDTGSGSYSWIAAGITWAADNGAHVINMSLGGTSSSSLLEDAVNYAWDKGVVVVAAAGNSGTSSPIYPAYYANCIAVAATDREDNLASWSSFGDWVDVAAPGVLIFSTTNDGSYGRRSGTSMASPHVAGLAALLFTVVTDENGNGRVNDEVRARIASTCDDIGIEGIGAGRINAARAVGAYDSEPEPEPGVQMAVAADPTTVSTAGDVVTYTYTINNIGQVDLTRVAVYDDLLGSISLAATTLSPGGDTTGTGIYTVTQGDIDSGADIVNIATVTTDQGVTDSATAAVSVDVPEVAAVTISPSARSGRGWPGDGVSHSFVVRNTGDVPDTYSMSVASGWASSLSRQSLTLEPGSYGVVRVTHSVPLDVAPGDFDSGTVQALSPQTGASASASFTTTARVSAVEITPDHQSDIGPAGNTVQYTYTIANTGTEDETFDLALSAAWQASLSTSSLSLAAGASATVVVSHAIPAGAVDGDSDTGTLTAASERATADATFATTAEEQGQQVGPVIQGLEATNTSDTDGMRAVVEWAASHQDGNLATVELLLVCDGKIVDSATISVGGSYARGQRGFRERDREGDTYEITLIVTDTNGNTANRTVPVNP